MYEIAWMEFNKRGKLVTKRKSFKSEAARACFTAKLFDSDNFYKILAFSD